MPAGVSAEIKTHQLYINGEWVESSSEKTFSVYDPASEEVIAQVPDANSADVNRAVAAAKAAFDSARVKPGMLPPISAMQRINAGVLGRSVVAGSSRAKSPGSDLA